MGAGRPLDPDDPRAQPNRPPTKGRAVTAETLTQPTTIRRARDLAEGDRIAAGFLPDGYAAEVVFVRPYEAHGHRWAFVVHRFDDGAHDAWPFLADKPIPLESVAAADLHEGRTTACCKARPDTLGLPLGRAAEQGR